MQLTRRTALAITSALALDPASARAQTAPAARQVRLVVPFPPGGPTDAAGRLVGEGLREGDGPAAIVENKPGGAGTIGARLVRDAAPDGTTVVLGNNQTHATAPFLIKDAGYDPVADFTPIGAVGAFPHVLVVRTDLGAGTLAELIALAKARPGALNYGSTGIGSGSHLAMELLSARAGLRLQHVPYQGAAQMAGDIAAKRLDLSLAILPSVLPQIAAGGMTALAVASARRLGRLADVPTLKEAGVEGAESESWLALFGPKGVPAARVAALQAQLAARLGQADVQQRLAGLGITVSEARPAHLAETHPREVQRWREIIQSLGLKPE